MWNLTAFALLFTLTLLCSAQNSEEDCAKTCVNGYMYTVNKKETRNTYGRCPCRPYALRSSRNFEGGYPTYRDQHPYDLLRDYLKQYEDLRRETDFRLNVSFQLQDGRR
ncbi:uncharacterized protein LOC118202511 isoform X2 [Stegodyphus dumicola]|uniref:uncharacterized protein LOC118202511 isoform X2 n=1 Tax=Stegodyphus dumicola TaxID=202533 RepID=UPI0015AB7866|nr:uncharacterized protein LOC118202511 isoform X2 [Stegodyphus dumicola]